MFCLLTRVSPPVNTIIMCCSSASTLFIVYYYRLLKYGPHIELRGVGVIIGRFIQISNKSTGLYMCYYIQ